MFPRFYANGSALCPCDVRGTRLPETLQKLSLVLLPLSLELGRTGPASVNLALHGNRRERQKKRWPSRGTSGSTRSNLQCFSSAHVPGFQGPSAWNRATCRREQPYGMLCAYVSIASKRPGRAFMTSLLINACAGMRVCLRGCVD